MSAVFCATGLLLEHLFPACTPNPVPAHIEPCNTSLSNSAHCTYLPINLVQSDALATARDIKASHES